MQTALMIIGQVAGVSKKEFKGELTVKWQFLVDDGESISTIDVKRGEGDLVEYERGEKVRIPVTVSTMNNSNQLFYKTLPHEKAKDGAEKK